MITGFLLALISFCSPAWGIGFFQASPLTVLKQDLALTEEGRWVLSQGGLMGGLPSLFKATKDARFFKLSLAAMCLTLFERHFQNPHLRTEFLLEYGTEVLATGVNLGKPYPKHLQFFFYAAAMEFEIFKFLTTANPSSYEDYDLANLLFYTQGLRQEFPQWFSKKSRVLEELALAMEQQAAGVLVYRLPVLNEIVHRRFATETPFIVSAMLQDMGKRLKEEGAIP